MADVIRLNHRVLSEDARLYTIKSITNALHRFVGAVAIQWARSYGISQRVIETKREAERATNKFYQMGPF